MPARTDVSAALRSLGLGTLGNAGKKEFGSRLEGRAEPGEAQLQFRQARRQVAPDRQNEALNYTF